MRNLACSLVPSLTTDGSQQIMLMYVLVLPMFIAQVRAWPWRDELANQHDLIMVASLLITLVIALALQVPTESSDSWTHFLEVLSTLTFLSALIICLGILLNFLMKEYKVERFQKSKLGGGEGSTSSLTLPTLMTSQTAGKDGSMTTGPGDSQNAKSWSLGRTSRGLESLDDKVLDIYKTLSALNSRQNADESSLLELVKQMGNELPTADLKKLQWGMGVVGYHVLGDLTKRPSGISLAPASTRSVSVVLPSPRPTEDLDNAAVTV